MSHSSPLETIATKGSNMAEHYNTRQEVQQLQCKYNMLKEKAKACIKQPLFLFAFVSCTAISLNCLFVFKGFASPMISLRAWILLFCRMLLVKQRSWCWSIRNIRGGCMCLRTGSSSNKPHWLYCLIRREMWRLSRKHSSSCRYLLDFVNKWFQILFHHSKSTYSFKCRLKMLFKAIVLLYALYRICRRTAQRVRLY